MTQFDWHGIIFFTIMVIPKELLAENYVKRQQDV